VFDNKAETGSDVITDFGKGDMLLLSVALSDPDGDGVVETPGGNLELFGGSTVDLGASSVKTAGTVTIDGVTYYAYVSAASAPSGGALVQQTIEHHHVHDSLF
jgi:hypothetical protein